MVPTFLCIFASMPLCILLSLLSLSRHFHISAPYEYFFPFFFSTYHPLKMSFTCLHLTCTQTPFRVHLRNAFSPGHHPPPQAEVLHKQENCELFRAFPVYHQGIWKKGKGLSHSLPGPEWASPMPAWNQ